MNNYDGYVESNHQTDARAWHDVLKHVGYAPNLNTEKEAVAISCYLDACRTDAELPFAEAQDPRTLEQIDGDLWEQEWHDTQRSLLP